MVVLGVDKLMFLIPIFLDFAVGLHGFGLIMETLEIQFRHSTLIQNNFLVPKQYLL